MGDVKRWMIYTDEFEPDPMDYEDEEGPWVLHADHAREVDALQARLAEVEGLRAALLHISGDCIGQGCGETNTCDECIATRALTHSDDAPTPEEPMTVADAVKAIDDAGLRVHITPEDAPREHIDDGQGYREGERCGHSRLTYGRGPNATAACELCGAAICGKGSPPCVFRVNDLEYTPCPTHPRPGDPDTSTEEGGA